MNRAPLLLAALALGFAPLPKPRPNLGREDLTKMQGVWTYVRIERGGMDVTREYAETEVRIEGGRLTSTSWSRAGTKLIELDGRATPRRYTLGGRLALAGGIYELDGDTLQLSYFADWRDTGKRPATFVTREEKHVTLILKRVRPRPRAPAAAPPK
jgi:uncharacterized protein (TIGR03067 family)